MKEKLTKQNNKIHGPSEGTPILYGVDQFLYGGGYKLVQRDSKHVILSCERCMELEPPCTRLKPSQLVLFYQLNFEMGE